MYQRGRGESLTIPEPQQKKNLRLPLPGSMILGHVNQASMFSSEEKNNTSSQSIVTKTIFINMIMGAGKIAPQLKVPTALAEDLTSIPSTPVVWGGGANDSLQLQLWGS